MNIWIFNHHALTPQMAGGTRHFDFAQELVSRGHSVTIFAASFHYAQHKELKTYSSSYYLKEVIEGVTFIWLQTRPYKGNGLGRVLNMLDYMFKVQKVAHTISNKPDVIIGSSVHLFAVYAAYKVAKKLQVPFVMEVRDLWPQTLIDMGISKWHPFILLLSKLEVFLYNRADKIITLLPNASQYITKLGIAKEKITWISNGVALQDYSQEITPSSKGLFTVTYTGSLGKANVMHTFFEAAKALQDKNPKIVFQVFGDGDLKPYFANYIQQHHLTNITLYPSVPKDEIPNILMQSDLLYVGLLDSPLYRYGISLNKIFDYLASTTPIIFASNAYNNPIEEAKAGITISPENTQSLVEAILKYNALPKNQLQKNHKHVFQFVEKNYSIQTLTTKLETLLKGLI